VLFGAVTGAINAKIAQAVMVLPGAHQTGREHVTSNVHSIDGEIQTWRTYYKYSSFHKWIFYDETGNI